MRYLLRSFNVRGERYESGLLEKINSVIPQKHNIQIGFAIVGNQIARFEKKIYKFDLISDHDSNTCLHENMISFQIKAREKCFTRENNGFYPPVALNLRLRKVKLDVTLPRISSGTYQL